MTDLDLTGRKALVTGGAQGLGEGMAAGAGRGRRDASSSPTCRTTWAPRSPRGSARATRFVHLDVTDDDDWEAASPTPSSRLGGLDILVNNAGIEITSLLVDLDPAAARKQLEVNLLGTALGLKHAFRAMRPGGAAGQGGAVINVASVAATIAFPGIAVYSATKSACRPADPGRGDGVAASSATASASTASTPAWSRPRWVRASPTTWPRSGCSAPREEAVGAVIELTPSGRLGEVADMADAVVFLASDAVAVHQRRRPAGRRRDGDVTMPARRSPSSSTAPPATPAG